MSAFSSLPLVKAHAFGNVDFLLLTAPTVPPEIPPLWLDVSATGTVGLAPTG